MEWAGLLIRQIRQIDDFWCKIYDLRFSESQNLRAKSVDNQNQSPWGIEGLSKFWSITLPNKRDCSINGAYPVSSQSMNHEVIKLD